MSENQDFLTRITELARNNPRRIVLPEGTDDRVLAAAGQICQQGGAKIIILGEYDPVKWRAGELGYQLEGAEIISPQDPQRLERYAQKLFELRQAKGMTLEKARETVKDVSYFGTMMIALGEADGMVSGACHTTAETIRPALQIIKTKPGIPVVSGAFFMVGNGRTDLYADCAVTIDPTAEQLAAIAAASAQTARAFGLDPAVALLTYGTGNSGTGASIDKVRAALEQVRASNPDLNVDGPLQFDAAFDPTVASAKAPGSPVAGQANVFVFPNLDAGNITYKAVQRTSGALAIGPVLQGLNKPVNDLSRGANIADIVNTIILTSIQAQ